MSPVNRLVRCICREGNQCTTFWAIPNDVSLDLGVSVAMVAFTGEEIKDVGAP